MFEKSIHKKIKMITIVSFLLCVQFGLIVAVETYHQKSTIIMNSYSPYQVHWEQLNDSNTPPARFFASMVYNPISEKILMFGGANGPTLNDLWEFNYNQGSWINLNPSNPPQSRRETVMVYSSAVNKMIIYGGFSAELPIVLNDTWLYNPINNSWSKSENDNGPSYRRSHNMVFDSINQRVILFGGKNRKGQVLKDTWEYYPETDIWNNITSLTDPSRRIYHSMVYITSHQKILLFGGGLGDSGQAKNDTWIFNCQTDEWNEINPLIAPPATQSRDIVYDPILDKVFLWDTYNGLGWLFDFDTYEWMKIPSPLSPTFGRLIYGHSLEYNPAINKTLLFGGINENLAKGYLDETWIINIIEGNFTFPIATIDLTTSATSNSDVLSSSSEVTTWSFEWYLTLIPSFLLIYIKKRKKLLSMS
ncbi:MAG: Kelch repeat-containing protein [Candidatus Hodarchaeales archaeon]|jgi:hypothetical protein